MNGKLGVEKYYGNYDYYQEKVAKETIGEDHKTPIDATSNKAAKKKSNTQNKPAKKERELKRQICAIEEKIEKWENDKSTLHRHIEGHNPDADYTAINQELETLNNQINSAYTEWDNVTEQLERLKG